MNLDKTIRLSKLFDIYKGLLTEKQVFVLNSYLNYNGSLAEIAEELKISRQAVLDTVLRTSKRLENFEKKLNFCDKMEKLEGLVLSDIKSLGLKKELQEKLSYKLVQTIKQI